MSKKLSFSVVTPAVIVNEILLKTLECVAKQDYNGEIEHWIIFDRPREMIGPLPNFIIENDIEKKIQYRVLFTAGNQGPSAARNQALERIDSDVVCFLDGDDLWQPNYLKSLCEIYNGDSRIAAITVAGLEFGTLKRYGRITVPLVRPGFIGLRDMIWNPIGCPSGFSLKWFAGVSKLRFDEKLRFCEDYHFYLLIYLAGIREFYRPKNLWFWYRKSEFQSTRRPSPKVVEESRRTMLRSLSLSPFQNLTYLVTIQLTYHVNHRFDRLLSPSIYKRLSSIILLLMITPAWAIAQFRRLKQGKF